MQILAIFMQQRSPQSERMSRLALLAASLVPLTAAAAPETAPDAAPEGFHADVELDPTAYVLDGNSIHVGLGWRRLRLDVGNFAIAVPRLVHGNDGFDVAFYGYGAKLQWFPLAEQRGPFVGVDAAVVRARIDRRGSDAGARQLLIGGGVHVGYRIALPAGFYATPWIGVGYQLGAEDVMLGGATYEASALTIFPAIHLGYRFR
jgi:hypothetical protein